jgi:hypothetical protein
VATLALMKFLRVNFAICGSPVLAALSRQPHGRRLSLPVAARGAAPCAGANQVLQDSGRMLGSYAPYTMM